MYHVTCQEGEDASEVCGGAAKNNAALLVFCVRSRGRCLLLWAVWHVKS